jgi:photosystem II stability/assembly factor-like uncharacterized protein
MGYPCKAYRLKGLAMLEKTVARSFMKKTRRLGAGTFTSDQEGWVVGNDNLTRPLVLKTADGGKSWSEIKFDNKSTQQLNDKIQLLWDICFDPNGRARMLGDGGVVQVQMNERDLSILSIFPTQQYALNRISCSGSGDVWAVGRASSIYHFRDGWVKQDLNPSCSPSNVRTFGTDVWVIGKNDTGSGILLWSPDSGETWKNRTPRSAKALSDLFLKDGEGGLIGVEGSIFYTADNGESWQNVESPTKADLLYIYTLDFKNIWISGERTTVLKYRN